MYKSRAVEDSYRIYCFFIGKRSTLAFERRVGGFGMFTASYQLKGKTKEKEI